MQLSLLSLIASNIETYENQELSYQKSIIYEMLKFLMDERAQLLDFK